MTEESKCAEIKRILQLHGFKITNEIEDAEKCIIDFRHPKVEVKKPVAYFLSSVAFTPAKNFLDTTIRSKVDDVKELYLDYCCEQVDSEYCEQRCRPHVHMDEKILSVEAKFWQNPLKKFDRLIEEMK